MTVVFLFLHSHDFKMTRYNSYKAVKQAISSGETNCLLLVKHYLEQIEANKNLNVFLFYQTRFTNHSHAFHNHANKFYDYPNCSGRSGGAFFGAG